MKTATIYINRILTIIETNKVFSVKLGSLESVIEHYNTIEFKGTLSPAKFNKYQAVLLNKGFQITETHYMFNAGFEGKNSQDFNFNIEFKK